MKFALLNNERIEPQKGIKNAICPICGEIVVPKCGQVKIHHWAHQSIQNCDPWWESETEWHRKWKDNFPKECQEIIMYNDKTGEKHIADVKTATGIVLEFQHSSMKPEEQQSREQFYKNMIWVVDARKYYDKFKKGLDSKLLNHCEFNKYYFYQKIINSFEEQTNCFPKRWLDSSVPVIFDFGIHDDFEDNDYNEQKKWLWCIFPEKYTKSYNKTLCGLCLKKYNFINRVITNQKFYTNIVLNELEKLRIKREQEQQERERKCQEELKKHKQESFEIKYPKEEKWRDAIFNVKLDIKNNKLNPKKLYVKDGEIFDYNKNKYNGKKCMILGVKSYPAEYNGIRHIKNQVLLLVQNDDKIIPAIVYVPSPIINDIILFNNYNYYFRIMNVMPYYNKFSIYFDEPKDKNNRIYTTKKLEEHLKFIYENF